LTVNVPPGITTQPGNAEVTQGQSASFSVVATGTAPLSYQWNFNGSAMSDATDATLTLTSVQAAQAGNYTVVVSSAWGSVTSAVATLTVDVPPGITTQPQTETVIQSQNVFLSVVASGSGPLSYQWQATNSASGGFTNLANGGQISGANTNVLEISNVGSNNALLYRAIITSAYGSVTSSPAILEVVPPVLVDVQFLGTSGTGWPGGSGSPQTGPAILGASGDTWNQEGLTYYIYPGASTDINATPLVNSSNVTSGLTLTVRSSSNSVFGGHQTNSTPTDPATTNLMSSGILQFVLSANVDVWTFTVGGLSGYAGDHFNLVVYAAAPSPRTQTISVTGGASGGNTGSALTTSSTDCKLSNGAGDAFQIFTNGTLNGSNLVFTVNGGTAAVNTFSAYVNGFQLQIYNSPVITSQPASQTNVNGSTVQFSVGALGGPLGYQWQTNGGSGFVNVGNGGVFSGANSNVLTITSAPGYSAVSYQVIVTNNVGSVTSAPATLSLTPQISAQPASQSAITGVNASFSVVADGSAPLSYQWYCQGAPLAGANNSTLSLSSVETNNAGNYSVVVQNNYGSVTSTVATLTVYAPPGITTQPGKLEVTQGQNASFSVVTTGTAPLSYQWNFNGSAVSGANDATLTLSSVQAAQAGNYTVVVSNAWGSVTSAVATLTVDVPPGITTQPQSQTAVEGQVVSFSVVASGTGSLSYQWYLNGSTRGNNKSTLTVHNVKTNDAGNYAVVVQNNYGSVTSAVVSLTLVLPPTIISQPQSQTVAAGQSAVFSVGVSGTATAYQWNLNGSAVSGATNATLALTNVRTNLAGNYTVAVTNIAGSVVSAEAALTVTNPCVSLSVPDGAGMASNGFTFQLSVPVGCTYVILASTDFQTWTPIATNVAAAASVVFTDTEAASYPNRFYQVTTQ
jgi:hypothetical protein